MKISDETGEVRILNDYLRGASVISNEEAKEAYKRLIDKVIAKLQAKDNEREVAVREALVAARKRILDYFDRREPTANAWLAQKALVENIINSEIDRALKETT